jgi:hypothetical protein
MTPFAEWIVDRSLPYSTAPDVADLTSGDDQSYLAELIAELTIATELAEGLTFEDKLVTLKKANEDKHKAAYELRLTHEINAMETFLSDAVAKAMSPAIEQDLIRKGIEDFCALLKLQAGRQALPEIHITSPQRFYAALQERLTKEGIVTRIIESNRTEIIAHVGGIEVETEFAGWIENLRNTANP